MSHNLLEQQANTLRFLSTDMVQQANSGHPGAPMGLADIMTVLSHHLNINPNNAQWMNRDRIVFSGGHATPLIYSLLHLWGFNVTTDDLKQFRQLHSKTPGHPEFGHTHGIEITTGPLGQGIANAVGFSMASNHAQHILDETIINHNVYCLCGDGDLQEGISYEAIATAGHLNLSNLIVIYDSNRITIEGDTDLAWNEDVVQRFQAAHFDVIEIDGHDFKAIDQALTQAKASKRPVLIKANTIIAKGSFSMEGSHHTHGAPLGNLEIEQSKEKAGFNKDKQFFIDETVKKAFDKRPSGQKLEDQWNQTIRNSNKYSLFNDLLNPNFESIQYPDFSDCKQLATRESNHKILNAIAQSLPGFIGGSADLSPSNKTNLTQMGDFPEGKNIHFGIKEHAMAAICNAMNLYGLFQVFSATFFVFSDYLKPAARIAALTNIPHYFIWTHDSIGVGEDGPTHQPIEHLSAFRALPNFYVFRPADALENSACWQTAFKLNAPCAFVCSRQALEIVTKQKVLGDVSSGAYMIQQREKATLTLMASGSEVALALKTGEHLAKEGIIANIVSVPCFDLLCEQDQTYINTILNPQTTIFAIEASRGLEYHKFADYVYGINEFGASGKASDLFEHFGFSIEKFSQYIKEKSL